MVRHITMAIYKNDEDLELLKNICKKKKIEFSHTKTNNLFYHFTVVTDTAGLEDIRKDFGKEIVTTYYADLGNVADCDDEFLEKFEKLIAQIDKAGNVSRNANHAFLEFLMPIKDINVLLEIEKYSGHFSETQKRTLRSRKDVLNGVAQDVFLEEMVETAKSLSVDIKALRMKTGMSRTEFAKHFDIPYRTVEDWENKKSTCSSYLYKLMLKDLQRDGLIIN